jgi:hypothetical protein
MLGPGIRSGTSAGRTQAYIDSRAPRLVFSAGETMMLLMDARFVTEAAALAFLPKRQRRRFQ